MQWQDIVITVAQTGSVIALVPSLVGNDKPAVSSSLMTGGCIVLFGICYASYALWFSTATAAALSLLWFALAWQQWRRTRTVREVLK